MVSDTSDEAVLAGSGLVSVSSGSAGLLVEAWERGSAVVADDLSESVL